MGSDWFEKWHGLGRDLVSLLARGEVGQAEETIERMQALREANDTTPLSVKEAATLTAEKRRRRSPN